MANINSRNISQAEEALKLAYTDLIAFGKLFLPDDFMRSETPFFHYELADNIDNLECKQLAIILPRGHGKTVLTKASILKDFVFCPKDDMLFYAWYQLHKNSQLETWTTLNIILSLMTDFCTTSENYVDRNGQRKI